MLGDAKGEYYLQERGVGSGVQAVGTEAVRGQRADPNSELGSYLFA